MARRKRKNIWPLIIKSGFIVLIIGASFALGVFLYKSASNYLLESNRFKVKAIVIDPTLQFIHKSDLMRLKGRNIFKVELDEIERSLLRKYPEISELKVEKKFPDQIHLVAKKRVRMAQFLLGEEYLILDEKGVVLEKSDKEDKDLPAIEGLKLANPRINLGARLKGDELRAALKIIMSFRENPTLSSYQISQVEVGQLSKIFLHLNKNIKAIIDDRKIPYKIKVLGVVLTQGNLDLKEVKYIDLRFKEPIIGKK